MCENSKMFNIISRCFSFFNNTPPASWVAYITQGLLTCCSCLYYSPMGLQKPLIKLCDVRNESSSFVSEASNRSRFWLISEHKKSNLFRIELMFYCPIIGRFWFFSLILVRTLKFLFSGSYLLSFIVVGIAKSNTEGYTASILLSFMTPGHSFGFQILFIELKILFARI